MSLLRIGVKAPHLPKRRRPSGREKNPEFSPADVDEYNQRQLMRCVETRNRWQGDTDSEGPPGMRSATTVNKVEVAQRVLPPIELAAYMAKEHGTQEHTNQLVDEMERMIRRVASLQKWRVYHKAGQVDPIRLLASVVIEEWLSPAKYWVLREIDGKSIPKPKISVFSDAMGLKRDNWHSTWKVRFHDFQGYPQPWYDLGKIRVEGSL